MNLLSAMPELKRKEFDPDLNDLPCQENGEIAGYNQALDDLSKYSFSEEELAKLLYELGTNNKNWEEVSESKYDGWHTKEYHRNKAKALLCSLPLWLRRKES